jgi:hypothetical protein
MKPDKLHPVQFKKTLWELLVKAAGKQSQKQGEHITPAEYVRQVLAKHLQKKR